MLVRYSKRLFIFRVFFFLYLSLSSIVSLRCSFIYHRQCMQLMVVQHFIIYCVARINVARKRKQKTKKTTTTTTNTISETQMKIIQIKCITITKCKHWTHFHFDYFRDFIYSMAGGIVFPVNWQIFAPTDVSMQQSKFECARRMRAKLIDGAD